MTRELREEGLEQGRELGIEEGLRRAIDRIIARRFPNLTRVAEKRLAFIQQVALLENLVAQISMAQTDAEVKQYLLEALDQSL